MNWMRYLRAEKKTSRCPGLFMHTAWHRRTENPANVCAHSCTLFGAGVQQAGGQVQASYIGTDSEHSTRAGRAAATHHLPSSGQNSSACRPCSAGVTSSTVSSRPVGSGCRVVGGRKGKQGWAGWGRPGRAVVHTPPVVGRRGS